MINNYTLSSNSSHSLSERNVYCWILDTVEWEIYQCSILQMYGIVEKNWRDVFNFFIAGDCFKYWLAVVIDKSFLIVEIPNLEVSYTFASFNIQSEQQNSATLNINSGKLNLIFFHSPKTFGQSEDVNNTPTIFFSVSQI